MEEEKQLIFRLEFDTEAALKRSAEFRQAIDKDKEALSALNKTIKEQGTATAEQAKEREVLEKQIRQNTKARGDEIRAVDNYVKATKTSTGSIKEMRGELNFLTEQWNSLSEAERENKDVGGVLQKEMLELSEKLKTLEGSVGDTRRNVGNYATGLLQAADGTGLLAKVTSTAQEAQEKYNIVIAAMKSGLAGNISMLKLFKLAWAATGLGAVLLLLGGLISYLTKTQEGIDFVSRKTAALSTIMAVLTDKLSAVGQSAFEAFSSPKTALEALVKFIENQFMNRVKSIGVIFEALANRDFNKLQDGIAQLAFGVTDASAKAKALVAELGSVAKAAEAIEKENQRIRDAERALNVERAQSRKMVKELNLIAEDTTKTTEQRAAAAEKALKIEQRLLSRQLELQKERVANIEREQALTNNLTADNDKLADERAKLAQIETESLELQTTLQNKLNTIRKEGAALKAAEFKANREAAKKELDDYMALLKEFESEFKKQGEEEIKRKADQQKLIAQQFEASEKLRRAGLEQERLEAEERIRISKLVMAQKEQEYQAFVGLANASHALFAALADENSAFAEFEKAMALFKIGLASAEAITKGIAASQDLPFPGNLVAMATTIAAVGTNILQAKKLIDPNVPKAPKSKLADGGLLDGPSHAAGGITGTGRFANIEVEGGEAVINKRSTALFAPILSAINQMGGGRPLAPATYMASGGLVASSSRQMMNPQVPAIDYRKLARAISEQPIYVIPTEVRDKANAASARKVRAGLGA